MTMFKMQLVHTNWDLVAFKWNLFVTKNIYKDIQQYHKKSAGYGSASQKISDAVPYESIVKYRWSHSYQQRCG